MRDHENIEIRVRASGTNFWLGIDGDLVDEQSGVVQEFSLPVEYYEGVSDGESWTEGSREASAFLSALPAGQYMLRIAGQHEPPDVPLSFEVSVYENVARTDAFAAGAGGRFADPRHRAAAAMALPRIVRRGNGTCGETTGHTRWK